MQTTIEIPRQFQGPPGSGNGGYVSGLIAEHLDEAIMQEGVEVTLRAPTPLDLPLRMEAEQSRAAAYHGDLLIGEALPVNLSMEILDPPSFAVALVARSQSAALDPSIENVVTSGLGFHPVCFCCGADVPEGVGLRVFAAPVAGFDGVAAAWQPDTAFQRENGTLPLPVIWAALDCPGQFAFLAGGVRTGLLGRMTAKLLQPVHASDDLVIIGWCIGIEGRKHFAGTALFNSRGECCAYSKQVWIGRRD